MHVRHTAVLAMSNSETTKVPYASVEGKELAVGVLTLLQEYEVHETSTSSPPASPRLHNEREAASPVFEDSRGPSGNAAHAGLTQHGIRDPPRAAGKCAAATCRDIKLFVVLLATLAVSAICLVAP